MSINEDKTWHEGKIGGYSRHGVGAAYIKVSEGHKLTQVIA